MTMTTRRTLVGAGLALPAATLVGPTAQAGAAAGDPNSLESDKAPRRALFNGLAQLIVQSTGQPGPITIEAVDGSAGDKPHAPAALTLAATSTGSSERFLPR